MTTSVGTSDLLVKVLERSREDKIPWETVRDDDDIPIYYFTIADLKIEVRTPEYGIRGYNRGDPEFVVADADGTELDSITTSTDGGLWYSELLDLLRVARLYARRATGKYAAALEALDRTG